MSKYTTELRYLIESGYDLGLNDYPIFDESYRATLNQKIIDHYYFCEIGFETAGLFRRYLNTTMREIMPYYNQLYKSELIDLDPLTTHKMVEEYSRDFTEGTKRVANVTQTGTTDKDTTSDTNTDGKSVYSDFPQSMLPAGSIDGITYASNATIDETDTNVTANENTTASQDTDATENLSRSETETTKRESTGYDGSVADLLIKYRSTFLNIDMQIINKLKDLFMLVW